MKMIASVISASVLAVGLTASAAVEWWAVPAMSGERRMPDKDPTDGEKGGVVRIMMAQEEYEPGSFVVKSDEDLGKVRVVLGTFRNEKNGPLENAELDLAAKYLVKFEDLRPDIETRRAAYLLKQNTVR